MKGAPILILGGKKRSGKSVVSAFLEEHYGAVVISQSDPMKRFALACGIPVTNLWGSSEEREQPFSPELLRIWTVNGIRDAAVRLAADTFNDANVADMFLKWYLQEYEHAQTQQSYTARRFLQQLGTECGRNANPDSWAMCAEKTSFYLLSGGYRYERKVGLIKDTAAVAPAFAVIDDGRFRNEILRVKRLSGAALRLKRPATDGDTSEHTKHASETSLDLIPMEWWDAVVVNDGSLADLTWSVQEFIHSWLTFRALS